MKWLASVVLCAVACAPGAAGVATTGPDLAAFSGCIAVHNADMGYRRGVAPTAGDVRLIWGTLRTSRTTGARHAARVLKRAKTPARVEAAIGAAARWCVAAGVPPITVPTTRPPD